MIEFVVTTDEVAPTLTVMIERMDDLRAPLGVILSDALFSAQEQIVEGKGSLFGGDRWPDMAPATIAKGRDPATLLVETGGLLQSYSRGGEGNIFEVGPTEGEAGTAFVSPRSGFPYPAAQHRGANDGHYPPRPALAWYEERFPDYELVFLDHIFAQEDLSGSR